MAMTYVTESDIPFNKAFLMSERFKLLNMGPGTGVWLVDIQHSKWADIKKTALDVAKTFGDLEAIQKINQSNIKLWILNIYNHIIKSLPKCTEKLSLKAERV